MALEDIGQNIVASEYVIPVFLATIFAAAVLSSKSKVPYTMMLVGVGILVSLMSFSNLNIAGKFKIDPTLVIGFIIPPLIFEAMMKVKYEEFKKIRISALLLATLGVILATIIGGYLLIYFAHLPFITAFAFSALIAPTDAAIVIEIFKRIPVPRLLATLMESEASFNDATGVIAFSSVIALGVGAGILPMGQLGSNLDFAGPAKFYDLHDLLGVAINFSVVFLGGAGVGLAVSAGAEKLHALMDEPLSETALTIATVFGSVALANALGVSGLVAVAVAGLYFGNVTIKRENLISERTKNAAFYFWEIIAFFANSAAFLYLGSTMDVVKISQNLWIIGIALGSVLAARAASVYLILAVTSKFAKEKIPLMWRNVVVLGGMRGAISVALAASLPEGDLKNTIGTITFGVVLSSLIIQFVLLSAYVKRTFAKGVITEI